MRQMELELKPQLMIKKIYTHIEIHSPEGGAVLESVWVEIKGKGNRSPIVTGAHYKAGRPGGGN